MADANQELLSRAIRHAASLARYGTDLADKLVRLLNGADAEITKRLAAGLVGIEDRGQVLSPRTQARLAKLLREISALNGAIYAQLGDVLETQLNEFAGVEADFQRASLARAVPLSMEFALPAPTRLRAIIESSPFEGYLLRDHVEGLAAGRLARIGQTLRMGLVQGETTDQLVGRIRGTKAGGYLDGELQASRRYAQTIVRTAVNHVSNVTAQETWRTNDHVVRAWQFVATLDIRTTTDCASKDGDTYPIGEGPVPPRHLRCRSITVAVTKSLRELGVDADELPPGKRASMNGQVAGKTRYDDWLRDQSPGVQDEVLGPKRAEAFRANKLSLKDMVGDDGGKLTLDQLRKAHRGILG